VRIRLVRAARARGSAGSSTLHRFPGGTACLRRLDFAVTVQQATARPGPVLDVEREGVAWELSVNDSACAIIG
jgi:hypothetical protein